MPPMNSLGLRPLPSLRAEEESGSLLMEREGFVDEAVVSALVRAPHHPVRSMGQREDLALSADDMDFAGWRLSPTPAFTRTEVPPQVIDAIVRRAAPPMIEEPGLGNSHQGSHRWWLAGLAGVLSTMLFSVLLLTLSARPGMSYESVFSPHRLATPKPVVVEKPAPVAEPELTDAFSERP
jgi:hypothetical protein